MGFPVATAPADRVLRRLRLSWQHLFLAMALLAAEHGAGAQQFAFRNYLQSDGLADLSVQCLFQDRAGFVWVCTENGLFRHDGTDFERFGENEGIANSIIHSAIEDPSGRLWVGTSHGLFAGDAGKFREVRADGRTLDITAGKHLAAIAPGHLLVIEKNRLLELLPATAAGPWQSRFFFDAEQLRARPELGQLSSVHVDTAGRVWLGCGTRICSVDGNRLDSWGPQRGVPADTWSAVRVGRDGRVWARGLKHVAVLESGAGSFALRDPPHSALTADILTVPLVEDGEGRIVTRTDAGIALWERGQWREFGEKNGIGSNGITEMLVSSDGALWLGRSGRGLSRWLGYGNFESWTASLGLGADAVWSVVRRPESGVLVATRAGCSRLDEARHHVGPCAFEGLPKGEIQLLAARADGSLWLAMTTGELFRVGARQRRAELVARIPLMRQIFSDSRERIWICSNNGVDMIEPGSTRVTPMKLPVDAGEVTDAIEDADGAIWFATQGGLLRRAAGNWTLLHINDEHARDGFASVAAAQDGWLWAGSASQGMLHLHVAGDHVDRVEWVDEAALRRATVYFTHKDARGWIWAGTDAGIAVFDGLVWRRFSQQDGLIWNDTNQNSFLADTDGSAWIGTGAGLTHILHPERLAQAAPLDLQITRATLGNTPLDPRTPLPLAWQPDASLRVHLADMNFGEPRHTLLKVRMGGLSDTWYETRDHDLHYPGLAPGAYTLEAVAIDTDLQRRSRPVQLHVEILPPWWRSNWFQGLLAATALAALAALWKWRLRKLGVQKQELERQLTEHEALLVRATRDSLTGLWNRSAILEQLAREMAAARAAGTPLAIVLIDIDHFKRINDSYGHLAGDEVLRALGVQLASRIRVSDSLGRYGGEEFLLVAPGIPPAATVPTIERLRLAIAETPFSFNGTAVRVSASFGVAWLQPDAKVVADLIARADGMLYEAKNAGRNRIEYALAA